VPLVSAACGPRQATAPGEPPVEVLPDGDTGGRVDTPRRFGLGLVERVERVVLGRVPAAADGAALTARPGVQLQPEVPGAVPRVPRLVLAAQLRALAPELAAVLTAASAPLVGGTLHGCSP